VIHHAGRSSEQARIPSLTNLWKSRAWLYARHHVPLKRHLARLLVRVGMKRRACKASPEVAEACRQIVEAWGKAW
jgi:hypothetical protein